MADHYRVLGVRRDAPAEDVRRAYLELARTLHPDRTMSAPPAEAEQASRRMQDINEAWRVLRDPASRAAYDRALLAAVRPPRPANTPRPAPPRPPNDEDDDLDVPFHSAPAQPGDVGVSVVRALPWVTLTVILVAIFVFTAFAGRDRSPSGPQDLIGRCISSGSASAVVPVPCEGPNEGEVVLVVDRASLCPSESSRRSVAGDRWLCIRPAGDGR